MGNRFAWISVCVNSTTRLARDTPFELAHGGLLRVAATQRRSMDGVGVEQVARPHMLKACLKTMRGAAARDFGRGQGG